MSAFREEEVPAGFDAAKSLAAASVRELGLALLSKSPVAVIGISEAGDNEGARKMTLLLGGTEVQDGHGPEYLYQLVTEQYLNAFKRLRNEFGMPTTGAQFGLMELLKGIAEIDPAFSLMTMKPDELPTEPRMN